MDAARLAADLADRWDGATAVDALLDALERRDVSAAQALLSSSMVQSALAAEEWTRLEVIAAMAACGAATLASEAYGLVRADTRLALAPFGAGQTLLHRAAAVWDTAFAEILLELGADPNRRESAGHTPLYRAGNRFPRPASASGTTASSLVSLFCAKGADLDAADGVKRCAPLHMAARRGHADLARALVESGANIEARDSYGETPLRRAVNCSHPQVASVMMAMGADPLSRCNRGKTPRDAARTAVMADILGG
jgi:hypothetical protein